MHYINVRAYSARVSGDIYGRRDGAVDGAVDGTSESYCVYAQGHAGAVCDILHFPSLCPVPLGTPYRLPFPTYATFPDHLGNVVLEKSQPVIIMLES